MRVNNVVTNMQVGKMSYGCSLTFPSTALVELMGLAGLNHVSFDSEHGPFTPATIDDLCRVADMAKLTPMARVPNIDPSTILRFLDRGIMGITGPHITTAQRAQQLAESCRYTPRGKRSFGSGRGAYFGEFPSGVEYMENTNSQILVMAQLEDIEVLENLDDILAVDGIDLFSSGAQDIAQSMGLPGQPNHPRVKEFEAEVTSRVHAAGRKMTADVISAAGAARLFLDGARQFIQQAG